MIPILYTIFIIIIIYTIMDIYLSQTCCDAQAQRPSSHQPSWPPPTARRPHRGGLAGRGRPPDGALLLARAVRRRRARGVATPITSDNYQSLSYPWRGGPGPGGHHPAPRPC